MTPAQARRGVSICNSLLVFFGVFFGSLVILTLLGVGS